MHWLQAIDVALFHFINGLLSNPFFERLMPFWCETKLGEYPSVFSEMAMGNRTKK